MNQMNRSSRKNPRRRTNDRFRTRGDHHIRQSHHCAVRRFGLSRSMCRRVIRCHATHCFASHCFANRCRVIRPWLRLYRMVRFAMHRVVNRRDGVHRGELRRRRWTRRHPRCAVFPCHRHAASAVGRRHVVDRGGLRHTRWLPQRPLQSPFHAVACAPPRLHLQRPSAATPQRRAERLPRVHVGSPIHPGARGPV
jgi:hypothetical protein